MRIVGRRSFEHLFEQFLSRLPQLGLHTLARQSQAIGIRICHRQIFQALAKVFLRISPILGLLRHFASRFPGFGVLLQIWNELRENIEDATHHRHKHNDGQPGIASTGLQAVKPQGKLQGKNENSKYTHGTHTTYEDSGQFTLIGKALR